MASYPSEIARMIGIHPTNILGGLRWMGSRFDESSSLLNVRLVEKVELGNATYYRLSEPSPFHRIMSGYLQTSPIPASAYK
jgi:predicted transcriptional regulator with HTH domain